LDLWKTSLVHELTEDDGGPICESVDRLFKRDLDIFTDDFLFLFSRLLPSFNQRCPKHFLFANFRCLQCGQCCDDERSVYVEDIERWLLEERFDILGYVDCFQRDAFCGSVITDRICDDCHKTGKDLITHTDSGRCPFVRKVGNKPYYKCRIQTTKPEECLGHLCLKSFPVAHLTWNSIGELISMIGLQEYLNLTIIERRGLSQHCETQQLSSSRCIGSIL